MCAHVPLKRFFIFSHARTWIGIAPMRCEFDGPVASPTAQQSRSRQCKRSITDHRDKLTKTNESGRVTNAHVQLGRMMRDGDLRWAVTFSIFCVRNELLCLAPLESANRARCAHTRAIACMRSACASSAFNLASQDELERCRAAQLSRQPGTCARDMTKSQKFALSLRVHSS